MGNSTHHAAIAAQLLKELQAKPQDLALLARAARALEAAGDPAEATRLLLQNHKNVTAHEVGPLPGLCKRTLQPGMIRAQVGSDVYYREFSLALGRVLFFWVPAELPRKPALARSVGGELEGRLNQGKGRAKRWSGRA